MPHHVPDLRDGDAAGRREGATEILAKPGRGPPPDSFPHSIDEIDLGFDRLHRKLVELVAVTAFGGAPSLLDGLGLFLLLGAIRHGVEVYRRRTDSTGHRPIPTRRSTPGCEHDSKVSSRDHPVPVQIRRSSRTTPVGEQDPQIGSAHDSIPIEVG